jgi:NADPH:quinone reductase-like Zn-dependent oxidoreductase
MSKVVRFFERGGPEVLKIEQLPDRDPGPEEVRLRVEAVGLNRADVQFRQGIYIEQPVFPARLGYEAVGVVEAVGDGVSGIETGARVNTLPAFSLSSHGVCGQTAIVPARALVPHPAGLAPEAAAAVWMSYLTAYGGLGEGQRLDGRFVLLTAATGGVGRAAIQMAKSQGATVIATTRSAAKVASLQQGGADHVIDTSGESLVERVRDITGGRGADLVFDPIAGPSVVELFEAAAPGGTVRLYGYFGGLATPLPLVPFLLKGLTVCPFNVFRLTADPERLARARAHIVQGLRQGSFKPVVDRVFSLDEIAGAHRYLESNQQNGKVVVRT